MTFDDMMELVLQASHSIQNMGFNVCEVNVIELNTRNDPPTLIMETKETADTPPIRLISML
jgi:hypothetical protein